MRYSQEFKDNVVARLLSKELSISEAVEQYSIGKSTISYWLKIAREQAGCGTLPNKGNPKLMASLKPCMPKRRPGPAASLNRLTLLFFATPRALTSTSAWRSLILMVPLLTQPCSKRSA